VRFPYDIKLLLQSHLREIRDRREAICCRFAAGLEGEPHPVACPSLAVERPAWGAVASCVDDAGEEHGGMRGQPHGTQPGRNFIEINSTFWG